MRRGAAAVGALGVAVLIGCGGSTRTRADIGKRVFAASCSGCHTLGLQARTSGGDLAGYRMSAAQVASFARVMPTPRPLGGDELAAVALYVAQHQRPHAGRGR